jgi:hypothetical protein
MSYPEKHLNPLRSKPSANHDPPKPLPVCDDFMSARHYLCDACCRACLPRNHLSSRLSQDLYSRQIGAFGLSTMLKLVRMKVLIVGVRGVGERSRPLSIQHCSFACGNVSKRLESTVHACIESTSGLAPVAEGTSFL